MTSSYRAVLAYWAPIPLRLIVGYGFLMHGVLKLERGVDVFAAALDGIGVPFSHLMAWITIVIELLAGLATEGQTIVMVTHDLDALHYARRTIALVDGRVAEAGVHA